MMVPTRMCNGVAGISTINPESSASRTLPPQWLPVLFATGDPRPPPPSPYPAPPPMPSFRTAQLQMFGALPGCTYSPEAKAQSGAPGK